MLFFPRDMHVTQKDSFCHSKGVLLQYKRSPFAVQKESFCSPKGVLLKCGGYPWARHMGYEPLRERLIGLPAGHVISVTKMCHECRM